ncbi:hypothetical protein ACFPN1_10390 [Lysobacter yangpyeongensis]|uniref:Alanine acetyltransferase n=1 Tax=Lysobacter yangpyeongensis TaxID=346182 RepID=A0ABW0SN19_9GAMM
MATSGLPWSPEQREWLRALGHEVLRAGPMEEIAPAEPARPARTDASVKLRNEAGDANAAARRASVGAAAPAPAVLLRALARAADRDERDPEFLQALPDLATLRGNPAARRDLWPRLRSLRRRTPQ